MPSLVATSEIVESGRRLDSAEAFFALFPAAWQAVMREVWKLETRQTYQEPGNPSWELFVNGDLKGAIQILPEVRQVDVPLYDALAQRGVRFIRTRPVSFPLTPYLTWELECYSFNAKHGEDIRFLDFEKPNDLFNRYARHDFMLFDQSYALVHDYDSSGLICGGWEITSQSSVSNLAQLYRHILEQALPYIDFLEQHSH